MSAATDIGERPNASRIIMQLMNSMLPRNPLDKSNSIRWKTAIRPSF